jgi:hypothetical protein
MFESAAELIALLSNHSCRETKKYCEALLSVMRMRAATHSMSYQIEDCDEEDLPLRNQLVDSASIVAILTFMKRYDKYKDVNEECCAALSILIKDEKLLAEFLKEQGPFIVLKVMRTHEDVSSIIWYASMIIADVSWDSSQRSRLTRENCIPLALHNLRKFPASEVITQYSCVILHNLGKNANLIPKMLTEGLIPLLLAAVSAHDSCPEVMAWIFRCLATLAHFSKQARRQQLSIDADLPAILHRQLQAQRSAPDVLAPLCSLWAQLWENASSTEMEEISLRFVGLGSFQELWRRMKFYPTHSWFQTQAFMVCWRGSRCLDVLALLQDAGRGSDMLGWTCRMLREHHANRLLCTHAAGFIAGWLEHKASFGTDEACSSMLLAWKRELLNLSGHKWLLQAVLEHESYDPLQETGNQALTNLLTSSPRLVEPLQEAALSLAEEMGLITHQCVVIFRIAAASNTTSHPTSLTTNTTSTSVQPSSRSLAIQQGIVEGWYNIALLNGGQHMALLQEEGILGALIKMILPLPNLSVALAALTFPLLLCYGARLQSEAVTHALPAGSYQREQQMEMQSLFAMLPRSIVAMLRKFPSERELQIQGLLLLANACILSSCVEELLHLQGVNLICSIMRRYYSNVQVQGAGAHCLWQWLEGARVGKVDVESALHTKLVKEQAMAVLQSAFHYIAILHHKENEEEAVKVMNANAVHALLGAMWRCGGADLLAAQLDRVQLTEDLQSIAGRKSLMLSQRSDADGGMTSHDLARGLSHFLEVTLLIA